MPKEVHQPDSAQEVGEPKQALGAAGAQSDKEVAHVDRSQADEHSRPTAQTPASKKTNAPNTDSTVKATDIPAFRRGRLLQPIPAKREPVDPVSAAGNGRHVHGLVVEHLQNGQAQEQQQSDHGLTQAGQEYAPTPMDLSTARSRSGKPNNSCRPQMS